MNSTREQSRDHPAGREVVVALTGCSTQDARTVFDVLRRSFDSDRPESDSPRQAEGPRPTVWMATVDVSEARAVAEPAHLSAPVMVDAQGGYWAVERLRQQLTGAFAVRVVGTAAGDQEEEVRLRLESH
ncbi:hypothetical protein OHA98_23645 [Streptomyces sp. NBC_00654]|uniref:hypothetical protein n=1 Tax=Streptomyces sp. NBC_00654 TaxID=2975799 RepID=UPI00224EFA56|nr:hypothetical protein [Streptomyces sp. NBC_00654]MCX4967697.1 hypothetical protein [Streptomyces sp. NBC_00654]